MTWFLAFAVGCVTGILSGFGVGGGTLLLIYLTAFAGMGQQEAQGINLIYFLPAALTALPSHIKNRFVDWKAVIPAVIAGLLFSGLAAWFSNGLDMTLLRKCFGVFLLIIGISELLPRNRHKEQKDPIEKTS
jgi:uncharacterized membrane protein YfcA